MSPRSLEECTELKSVISYSMEQIETGENLNGYVSGSTEKTTDVLIAGADTHFIKKRGMDCNYPWILQETKEAIESEMTPNAGNLQSDYHTLASLLKVPQEEYSNEKSRTDYIIRHWCNKKKKRMTFGAIYTLLKHPGIIGNQDAARVLRDMLEVHGHQVNNKTMN